MSTAPTTSFLFSLMVIFFSAVFWPSVGNGEMELVSRGSYPDNIVANLRQKIENQKAAAEAAKLRWQQVLEGIEDPFAKSDTMNAMNREAREHLSIINELQNQLPRAEEEARWKPGPNGNENIKIPGVEAWVVKYRKYVVEERVQSRTVPGGVELLTRTVTETIPHSSPDAIAANTANVLALSADRGKTWDREVASFKAELWDGIVERIRRERAPWKSAQEKALAGRDPLLQKRVQKKINELDKRLVDALAYWEQRIPPFQNEFVAYFEPNIPPVAVGMLNEGWGYSEIQVELDTRLAGERARKQAVENEVLNVWSGGRVEKNVKVPGSLKTDWESFSAKALLDDEEKLFAPFLEAKKKFRKKYDDKIAEFKGKYLPWLEEYRKSVEAWIQESEDLLKAEPEEHVRRPIALVYEREKATRLKFIAAIDDEVKKLAAREAGFTEYCDGMWGWFYEHNWTVENGEKDLAAKFEQHAARWEPSYRELGPRWQSAAGGEATEHKRRFAGVAELLKVERDRYPIVLSPVNSPYEYVQERVGGVTSLFYTADPAQKVRLATIVGKRSFHWQANEAVFLADSITLADGTVKTAPGGVGVYWVGGKVKFIFQSPGEKWELAQTSFMPSLGGEFLVKFRESSGEWVDDVWFQVTDQSDKGVQLKPNDVDAEKIPVGKLNRSEIWETDEKKFRQSTHTDVLALD